MLKSVNKLSVLAPKQFFRFFTLPLFFILLSFFYFKYQYVPDPDGYSYSEIALKYRQGNLIDAINGYWSPLYSWIAVPFLYFTKNAFLILKIINGIAALLCLIKLKKIISSVSINVHIEVLLQLSFALALSSYAFSDITPDLLNLYFLLIYLQLVINHEVFEKPIKTGIIGVLLYLSKYYTFWFFLAHLSVTLFLELFKKKSFSHICLSYLKIILVFIAGCGLWIICLSVKYKHPLISTSGSYNHSIVATGEINHEWQKSGIIVPYKNNLFAWEEITLCYPHKDWSPFDSKKNLLTQWHLVKNNFKIVFDYLNASTRYGFYLNLIILLLTLKSYGFKKELLGNVNFQLILFGAIFFSGYLYILCVYRYIRILYFLSALSITVFLSEKLRTFNIGRFYSVGIILLSYCLFTYHVANTFYATERDVCYYPENQSAVKKLLTSDDKVISSLTFFGFPFITEVRYQHYGSYNGYNKDENALLKDIKKYKITAVIIPDTTTYIPSFFLKLEKVSFPLKGLYLYKIDTALLNK